MKIRLFKPGKFPIQPFDRVVCRAVACYGSTLLQRNSIGKQTYISPIRFMRSIPSLQNFLGVVYEIMLRFYRLWTFLNELGFVRMNCSAFQADGY